MNVKTSIIVLAMSLVTGMASCRKETSNAFLEDYIKEHPEVQRKYVYQSLIRLANVDQDPDFEKLIKDVRKLVLYFPPEQDTTYDVKSLRPTIREEGYEELVDVRATDKSRVSLWVNESTGRAQYLALMDSEDGDFILEIDGEPDLKYLSSVSKLSQGTISNMLSTTF